MSILNFISAQSKFINGIEVEDDVIKALENEEWVPIIVELRDTAYIDSLLSQFGDDEFVLKRKLINDEGFSGNITKKGFDKLVNNPHVKKVYLNRVAHILTKNETLEQEINKSNALQIDPLIQQEFDKGEEWVRVIIYLKDMSKSDEFISRFSEDEFKLIRKSSTRIGALINEEGYQKLIGNPSVSEIYFDSVGTTQFNETITEPEIKNSLNKNYFFYLIIVLLLVLLTILFKKVGEKK